MFIIVVVLSLSLSTFALDTLWTPIDIPTRTGDSLAADIYTLDSTAAKPVILIQTPYNKADYRFASFMLDTSDTSGFWDIQHYNFVILDWRGFYASTSAGSTGYDRGLDGYDAVEWIASQSWCNGKIGTYGGSALGDSQFKTAHHQPSNLLCAAPWIKTYKTRYTNYYYGGVYKKEYVEALDFLGFIATSVILSRPLYSFVWQYIENNSDYPEDFKVPMLMLSGWFDHYPADIIEDFHEIRSRSDISVRDKHKLIMGPWTHSGVGQSMQGELEYPAAADFEKPITKKFFDHYLRGADNDYESEPVGQYFLMGSNIWIETDNWYSLIDDTDTLYIHQDGHLFPLVAPIWGTPPDSFVYDPRDPSPAYGFNRFNPAEPGLISGPRDMRDSVENRDDNLIYSTDILTEPLTIIGRIKAKLFVESNCLDTDFAIRISDVYPDGRSMILTQGILRGRLRDTLGVEHLMVLDSIYEIDIETEVIAQTFLPGHKLRLVITSSIYPHFHANINDGGSMYDEGDTTVATNFIHHNEALPSALILPLSSELRISERSIATKPNDFSLRAYPNPFNSAVRISLDFGSKSAKALSTSPPSACRVEIYDINGRRVAEISVNGSESAKALSTNASGACRWQPDAAIGSGVYFVRAHFNDATASRRILYIR